MKVKRTIFVMSVLMTSSILQAEALRPSRMVTIAVANWEPYYLEDTRNGILTDITIEAFKRVGYEAKITFMPWARVLHDTKNGHYDGLSGAYDTEENRKHFSFPRAIWTSEIVVAVRSGKNIPYKELNDLSGYTIGMTRGSELIPQFQAAGAIVEEVTSEEQNVKKLLHNRIDGMMNLREGFSHLLRTRFAEHIHEVKFLEPPVGEIAIYTVFSKAKAGHQKLTEDFEKGLRLMQADGTYDDIRNKYRLQESPTE